MLSHELKEYIIQNNKLEIIIEDLGCHHFKEYSKEYRCGLPDHKSTNSISIKKETLSVKIFQSDSEIIKGDLFTLIMKIKNISFSEANKYVHKLLGLKYKYNKDKKETENKKNPLNIFEKVKKKRLVVNKDELEMIDDNILKEYINLPHIDWIKDGIMPWACEKFNIGYSFDKKRIIIPHRYWCGDENEFIGIIGRTTIKEFELLEIPKYFPLKPYPKSINLYGLQENYESIQEAGYVVVVESEKSTLKRYSRADKTCVSVCSHSLSEEQVKILIGLDVDIIIAYDKDIGEQYIWSECDKFYMTRNIYYMIDKWGILKDKESPCDLPDKQYRFMLKHKTKYDKSKHEKYIEWRSKNGKI